MKDLTEFMAERYRAGPDAVRSIIDVAFAENLMWNLDEQAKAWAWPFVAEEIRQLHAGMWGPPRETPAPGR